MSLAPENIKKKSGFPEEWTAYRTVDTTYTSGQANRSGDHVTQGRQSTTTGHRMSEVLI